MLLGWLVNTIQFYTAASEQWFNLLIFHYLFYLETPDVKDRQLFLQMTNMQRFLVKNRTKPTKLQRQQELDKQNNNFPIICHIFF